MTEKVDSDLELDVVDSRYRGNGKYEVWAKFRDKSDGGIFEERSFPVDEDVFKDEDLLQKRFERVLEGMERKKKKFDKMKTGSKRDKPSYDVDPKKVIGRKVDKYTKEDDR